MPTAFEHSMVFVLFVAVVGLVLSRKQSIERVKRGAEKSERRFRKLLEISPDAIVVSRESGITMANAAAAKVFGVATSDALIGRRLHDFMAPGSQAESSRLRQALFSGPVQVTPHDLRLLSGDREIDVEIAGASYFDDEGAIVQAVIRDVTDRKRAEEALRASEARVRAITDSAQNAIIMMDSHGAISHWNLAAQTILGYRWEEAIGKDLHELLVPERFRQAHQAAIPEFLRSGRGNLVGKTVELSACRKDGTEIAVDLSLSRVGLKGEWHALGILRDITPRKEAEQALRDSEEKFRQLAENIREVFFVIAPDAGKTLYVSPAFEQIWGMSCDRIYQNPLAWQEAVHPEDLDRIRTSAANRFRGEPSQFEYRIRTSNGQEKWIRSRSFPVHDDVGNLIRVVGIAEEVTERKRHEQELVKAREDAEAANRAKSVFLATMSHELRTPLNAVLGFAELLEVEMGDQGIHTWDSEIQRIRRSGTHLLGLISDIMDLSKIEAGKMELKPETFDAGALIQEVVANLEPLAAKNRVAIRVACEPVNLYADRVRVGQCLFNLVGNACKFTHDGKVSVEAKLECGCIGDWYTVCVTDTGIGIGPEDLRRLFSNFTQVDSSSARKYGGTGLGLAISRRLSRLMGGDITAESVVGQGSTFTFRIPVGYAGGGTISE